MEKYKTSKFDESAMEIFAYIFIIGIPLGIWIEDYRWKLICTSLFALFLAIIIANADNQKEEKFKKEKKI